MFAEVDTLLSAMAVCNKNVSGVLTISIICTYLLTMLVVIKGGF